jgi:hypothetical protein
MTKIVGGDSVSPHRHTRRRIIGLRISDVGRRPPADAGYLDQVARRLAAHAGLSITLARRRVQALAISARRGDREGD